VAGQKLLQPPPFLLHLQGLQAPRRLLGEGLQVHDELPFQLLRLLHGEEDVLGGLFPGFKDDLRQGGGAGHAGLQELPELQGQAPGPLHLRLGQEAFLLGLPYRLHQLLQPAHLGPPQVAHPFQALLQVGQVLGLAQKGLLQLLLQGLQKGLGLPHEPGVGVLAEAVDEGPVAGHLRPVQIEAKALQARLQGLEVRRLRRRRELPQGLLHHPLGLLGGKPRLELPEGEALQKGLPVLWGKLLLALAQALQPLFQHRLGPGSQVAPQGLQNEPVDVRHPL